MHACMHACVPTNLLLASSLNLHPSLPSPIPSRTSCPPKNSAEITPKKAQHVVAWRCRCHNSVIHYLSPCYRPSAAYDSLIISPFPLQFHFLQFRFFHSKITTEKISFPSIPGKKKTFFSSSSSSLISFVSLCQTCPCQTSFSPFPKRTTHKTRIRLSFLHTTDTSTFLTHRTQVTSER